MNFSWYLILNFLFYQMSSLKFRRLKEFIFLQVFYLNDLILTNIIYLFYSFKIHQRNFNHQIELEIFLQIKQIFHYLPEDKNHSFIFIIDYHYTFYINLVQKSIPPSLDSDVKILNIHLNLNNNFLLWSLFMNHQNWEFHIHW